MRWWECGRSQQGSRAWIPAAFQRKKKRWDASVNHPTTTSCLSSATSFSFYSSYASTQTHTHTCIHTHTHKHWVCLAKLMSDHMTMLSGKLKTPPQSTKPSNNERACMKIFSFIPFACNSHEKLCKDYSKHLIQPCDIYFHHHLRSRLVVWLESITPTLSFCHKYSQEHWMCIHPPLEIVPPKIVLFTVVSVATVSIYLWHIFTVFSWNWLAWHPSINFIIGC